jgi:hypothetical protein
MIGWHKEYQEKGNTLLIHIIKSTAVGRVTLAQKGGMFHIRSNIPPYQLDIIVKKYHVEPVEH